jgi:hypothetical protein
VDFGGHFDLALHFLGYDNPRGLTSFYWGAGSTYELLWFNVIRSSKDGASYSDQRTTLYSGGLTLDLVAGWEFMRASAVQFFLQGEARLPAYIAQNENEEGAVHTWFPGVNLKIGMLF